VFCRSSLSIPKSETWQHTTSGLSLPVRNNMLHWTDRKPCRSAVFTVWYIGFEVKVFLLSNSVRILFQDAIRISAYIASYIRKAAGKWIGKDLQWSSHGPSHAPVFIWIFLIIFSRDIATFHFYDLQHKILNYIRVLFWNVTCI
jgi:hypothetical protein